MAFSRPADRGKVHSSGDWIAPQTGTTTFQRPASATCAVRSRSPLMQDKHNDDILEATKCFLQSARFHTNLSVHPNHLSLGVIRIRRSSCRSKTLESSTLRVSFYKGVFESIEFSDIWHRKKIEAREDLPLEIYDTIQENIYAKFAQEFYGDIAQANSVAKGNDRGPSHVPRSDQRDPRL